MVADRALARRIPVLAYVVLFALSHYLPVAPAAEDRAAVFHRALTVTAAFCDPAAIGGGHSYFHGRLAS